jgi:crossover junction endodeoxyribonuclease RuvC
LPQISDRATPTEPIRVLGVDPGLTRTGWALVTVDGRRYRLLDAGIVSPQPRASLAVRLADGHRAFQAVLAQSRPALVAMEDIFTAPRYPAAALKMAHLRGVLCLAAAQSEIDVLALTATTVKQRLTGNGHASKEQVQRMVFELCDLSGARTRSDVSDAVALAIAGLHQIRFAHAESLLAAARRTAPHRRSRGKLPDGQIVAR